jgi:hypothetical protein
MSGTATTYISSSFGTFDSSTDISLRTIIFGLDLLHIRSGVTLSSMLQSVSSNTKGTRVIVLQFSWAGGSGVRKAKEEAERRAAAGNPAPEPR